MFRFFMPPSSASRSVAESADSMGTRRRKRKEQGYEAPSPAAGKPKHSTSKKKKKRGLTKRDCQSLKLLRLTSDFENSACQSFFGSLMQQGALGNFFVHTCYDDNISINHNFWCLEKLGSEVNHVKTVLHPDLTLGKTVEGPSVVHVSRSSSIEEARKGLPIVMMEQEIMEAINGSSIVIICGETGSGKTAQVPQFLYEAGYGSRGTVGYQVRHEKKIREDCSIKFMTDGILLRELQSDLLLRQYSIIIIDEAHERSLSTDILIGMLSRVVWLRQQQEKMHAGSEASSENALTVLKLVLMNATLHVEDFISDRRLFHEPPAVLEVPTRQYPVTIHFSRKGDYGDYLRLASKKVIQIHRTLPLGGKLVFVTGKGEVDYLCQKLRKESQRMERVSKDITAVLEDNEAFKYSGLCILPLYAMLPADEQLRVFRDIPEGQRLVVVATNVAETSLTIPGIKYVVDSGREKVKNYNHRNGLAAYEIKWISKASAAQRAGRAGRTGPGHCYRLYSSAVFGNVFSDFSSPEITKVPVTGVLLMMKSMGIDKVASFPFPTPPQAAALTEADRCLKALEAVVSKGRLTRIGRAMSWYPMSPRHSRIALFQSNLVFAYAIASAAALSLHNPFIIPCHSRGNNENTREELDIDNERDGGRVSPPLKRQRVMGKPKPAVEENHLRFRNHNSDALTVSYLLQLHDLTGTKVEKEEFCRENLLHVKTIDEMSKLRKQLLELIFHLGGCDEEFHGVMEAQRMWNPPGRILAQAICAGWADRVAKRMQGCPKSSDKDLRVRAARYQSCALGETVFLHPSSSVSHSRPEFVVYTELLCTKRSYLHGVTGVKPEWLVKYASSLCNFSAPLLEPRPCYDSLKDGVFCWVRPSFGPHLWPLPLHGVPAENDMVRISIFACALLEGNVLPCLRCIMLRPESLGQSRVFNLLKKMKVGNVIIDRRAILCEAWRKNPQLLRSEIQCWFQEGFRHLFDELWEECRRRFSWRVSSFFLWPRERRRSREEKKQSC
ncbi:unnamed protein product [Spirodela intermedia]|uniref:Uncharacterized protein n=1 Tax=Spirodela intermedia TaxID=51605 RepID=A0A7I8IN22_SPIIN|nr:unnamed protein product [Spirodela intermedia]CAA6659189.1 unnamed protein product [Spirodela intermedia]